MTELCISGDVHGHLQLVLGVAARWQMQLDVEFEAVLMCGDIGTFTRSSQLDRATIRHAKDNPRELEFMTQWAVRGAAPWLEQIFASASYGGLGLKGLPIMTHGNHEGFAHLEKLIPSRIPDAPVPIDVLPRVDAGERIAYLPNGWRAYTPSGTIIGALGGIEPGQRAKAGYHPMAYLGEDEVLAIAGGNAIDVLITHQAPAETQGPVKGSELLDIVLESNVARSWFHGHSVDEKRREITHIGDTTVVPLRDITFGRRRAPEPDSMARVTVTQEEIRIDRQLPDCWTEFHPGGWLRRPDGKLVAPPIASFGRQEGR